VSATEAHDPLYDQLQEAERRDPDIREVLELLAGRPTPVTATVRQVARDLNRARGSQLRDAFVASSLTTAQVVELLDVADHRAVAARRARGTLLGWTIGNDTYHPDWQFTDTGTIVGLNRIVHALHEAAGSALAADQIMRRRRDDLGGRALAEIAAAGATDLAVRLIHASVR
jgi:hypothetical protein